LIVK
jgi:V-type H+-transporting ATPase subunit B